MTLKSKLGGVPVFVTIDPEHTSVLPGGWVDWRTFRQSHPAVPRGQYYPGWAWEEIPNNIVGPLLWGDILEEGS